MSKATPEELAILIRATDEASKPLRKISQLSPEEREQAIKDLDAETFAYPPSWLDSLHKEPKRPWWRFW